MKKYLSAMIIPIILFSFTACKKKEETIPQNTLKKGPIIDSPAPLSGYSSGQKVQFELIVPPDVKDNWSAVKLLVEDKKLNKTQEFTVRLGDELNIPDSNLTIKVGHFLPDLTIRGQMITSASNTPNNPSVGVIIFSEGKQIFPESGEWGWVYAKFPTMHSFRHERYSLILKEGVKK